VQRPTDVDPEDATEADVVVALNEDGDVEQENLDYSGHWLTIHRVSKARANTTAIQGKKSDL
jgi:hypothetical protein